MINTSGITYKELASPHFGEVFSLIEGICKKQKIPVYIIGAHAKIILLLEKGIKPGRGTKDIDFAIMIPDIVSYNSFLAVLEKVGFRKTSEAYRVIYDKTDTVIDILPFGQIEEEGTVKFTDRKTELSVVGMEEVLEGAVEIKHEGFNVKVAPLAGIMILKLISWKEKPYRTKDLDDIHEIILNFFEFSKDNFYKNHLYLIDELISDNFIIEAGSFMIGKEMGGIIKTNSFLRTSILDIINKEINEKPGSISIYFYQNEYFKDYALISRIFSLIHKGLNH